MNRPWLNQSMKTRGSLAVALLTILTGLGVASAAEEAICANAAVFFCDNFEDRATGFGDLETVKTSKSTGWALSSFSNGMAVATDEHFDGTKSLKYSYPACSWTDGQFTGCGPGYMTMHQGFNVNEWYMRHYVKFSSGFVWSPIATKHLALQTAIPGRRPWLYASGMGLIGSDKWFLEDEQGGNRAFQQNQGNAFVFATNTWYCIEIHVKYNSPTTSLVEVWSDDVPYLRYTDADLGGNWSEILLSGYWNTPNSPGSRGAQAKWFDNFVFSTQRIGCLGAQSSGPAAPSGVRAQ
jgi:hypothetical protein